MIFTDTDFSDWKPDDLIRSVQGLDLGIQLITRVNYDYERVYWKENGSDNMSRCCNFVRIKPPDSTTLKTDLGQLLAYAVLYCELHSKVCDPKVTHAHRFTKYDCIEIAKKILGMN
jgi:hypothetical protein